MDRKRQRDDEERDQQQAGEPSVAPSSPAPQRASSLPPFSDAFEPENEIIDEAVIENYLDDEEDDDGEDLFGDNLEESVFCLFWVFWSSSAPCSKSQLTQCV
jgi:hypothetical protein